LIVSLHCACGLRLPEAAHINQPSVDEQEAAQSGINTDLVAPAASSKSQYYQQQNYPNLQYFQALQQEAMQHAQQQAIAQVQHQAKLSPFLYTGPLIMMVHPGGHHTISHQVIVQPREPSDTENATPSHGPDTYILYRPDPADDPQFVDMLPPTEEQDETNYYGIKPKKTKKYSAVGEKKKHVKGKNLKEQIVDDGEDEAQDYDSAEEPAAEQQTDDTEEGREHREGDSGETSVEASAPSSRLDFQMHGNY
jgi:hypothetical protein